jgi:hypothetical protein
MHLFIISQPLCDGSISDYASSKISNQMTFLALSFSFRTLIENRHLRLANLIFGESLLVPYPETFQTVLLFKTLLTYRLERAIPRFLVSTAHVANRKQE